MSQQRVTWLAAELRTAGCTVKTYQGWKNRSRPTGDFNPIGLLWHHTGTPTSMARPAPTVPLCIRGRSDLPGPLCQVVLGYDGVWHVIAAGRANHAGTNDGVGTGPIPRGDGNAQFIGVEIDYSGSQNMGPLQWDSLIRGSAAILKHMRRDESYARGHKETSTTGKWDPGRRGSSSPEYLMGPLRGRVERVLTPRVYFTLNDGEGKQLAGSAVVREGWQREANQLDNFLDKRRSAILRELRGDGDVSIRRRRA